VLNTPIYWRIISIRNKNSWYDSFSQLYKIKKAYQSIRVLNFAQISDGPHSQTLDLADQKFRGREKCT
jgi:hypothetical protein